jgi:2,4-dienoyl-CoA reductase-like NADH-dependent reductase (Old Yellow Enzyme family)
MSAKALIQPLQLGAISLRNRVIVSATTRNRSVPTNVPNSLNVEFYEQRAAGGAGLIVTEGTLICQQGTEWPHAPGIWSQPQVDGWKKVTDAVHAKGGAIYCQLWHVGRVAHPDAPEHKASGRPVYGPSAIAARGGKFRFLPGSPGYVTPTAIVDPRVIVREFKQAGINAKEAGFDGVEVHGANGYIITQFLDSTSNHRTDEWGGSIENRARLGLEVVKELIEVWGADRVGIKLTPAGGYNDVGMPLEDTIATFSYFITEIDKLGVAYILLARFWEQGDPVIDGKGRGTVHDVVATYGPLIKNAKKIVNTSFTPEEGEEFVASGKADAVAFGMLWITHPDVTERIRLGQPLDNTPDYALLYGHDGTIEEQRKGYTDYPALEVLN